MHPPPAQREKIAAAAMEMWITRSASYRTFPQRNNSNQLVISVVDPDRPQRYLLQAQLFVCERRGKNVQKMNVGMGAQSVPFFGSHIAGHAGAEFPGPACGNIDHLAGA